jgi:O-antigen/teichoic acid export membrane protein
MTAPSIAHGVAAAATRGQDGTLVVAVRYRARLAVLATAVALGIAYYVGRTGDHVLAQLILVSAGYLLFGAATLTFRQYLVGKGAFRQLAPWDLAMGVLPPVAMAAAALATGSIVAVSVATLGVQAVVAAAGYAWVVRTWRVRERFDRGDIDREALRYGLKMVPLSAMSTLAGEGTTVVVAYVLGFEALAVFAVADRLISRISRIAVDVARDTLRPEFAARDAVRLAAGLRRSFRTIAVGLLGLGAVVLAVGVVYLGVAMPSSYRGAVWLYAVMALGMPARVFQAVLLVIPSVNLRAVEEGVPVIFSDVIRIVGAAAGGYWLGTTGVALAVVASAWAGAAASWYVSAGRHAPAKPAVSVLR